MSVPIPKANFATSAESRTVTSCKTPSDLPDEGVINRSDPQAMLVWAQILGVHSVQILVAVAVVGPKHDDVRTYLRERKTCFRTEN